MTFDDFEKHLSATGHVVDSVSGTDNQEYLVVKALHVSAGSNAGKTCDVAIQRSGANPWVPQAAVHVRPHLVAMGQASSQASPLGPEWQYLSRRHDRSPTPKAFLVHIMTVLSEL